MFVVRERTVACALCLPGTLWRPRYSVDPVSANAAE
jgi:hypothetical protein